MLQHLQSEQLTGVVYRAKEGGRFRLFLIPYLFNKLLYFWSYMKSLSFNYCIPIHNREIDDPIKILEADGIKVSNSGYSLFLRLRKNRVMIAWVMHLI